MFDWENLRHFLAVAQYGSLSGAARKLGVDHATVGRKVTALEAALGVKLIDRMPRKLMLTQTGQQVYELAINLESAAFSITRAVRAGQSHLVGKVVISAPPILATHFFASAAADFRHDYPGVELSIMGEPDVISLSRREADIAIRLIEPKEPDSVIRNIGTMAFGLYASPDYPHLADACAWEFIAYDAQYAEFPHQKATLRAADQRTICFRVSDITGQYAAARAGVGVALLPRFLADASADLIKLDNKNASLTLDIWLAVHHELKNTPSIRAAIDFFTHRMSECPGLRRTEGR